MNRWVVDTGPLIFLAKLDRLDLLQRGADEISTPSAVLAEVRALRDEAAKKVEIASQSWLKVQADARRFAHRVGLSVIGTMGLLLAARLRGEIPSVKAEIERLRQLGFWTGEALIEAILQAANE